MSWHPIKIFLKNHHSPDNIYMSIPALFLVTKRDLAKRYPDMVRGARFLYLFATKLLGCSSPRGFHFLTFSSDLDLALHDPHHQISNYGPRM